MIYYICILYDICQLHVYYGRRWCSLISWIFPWNMRISQNARANTPFPKRKVDYSYYLMIIVQCKKNGNHAVMNFAFSNPWWWPCPRYSASDDPSLWKEQNCSDAEVDYGAEEWASTSTDLKEIPTPMFSLVARVSSIWKIKCERGDVWHSVAYLSENEDQRIILVRHWE